MPSSAGPWYALISTAVADRAGFWAYLLSSPADLGFRPREGLLSGRGQVAGFGVARRDLGCSRNQVPDSVDRSWRGLAVGPRTDGSTLIIHTASPSLGIGRVLAIACFFEFPIAWNTVSHVSPNYI